MITSYTANSPRRLSKEEFQWRKKRTDDAGSTGRNGAWKGFGEAEKGAPMREPE